MDFTEFLESEIASIKIGKNIGSLNNSSAAFSFSFPYDNLSHRHVGIFNIVTYFIKALKSVFFFSMGIFAWCLSYLCADLTSFRICICVQLWACIFCFSAYSLSFYSSLACLPLSLTEQLKALQWILAPVRTGVSVDHLISGEGERYSSYAL